MHEYESASRWRPSFGPPTWMSTLFCPILLDPLATGPAVAATRALVCLVSVVVESAAQSADILRVNDPTSSPSLSPGGSIPIRRWAGAEQNDVAFFMRRDVAFFMRRVGFADAAVTRSGADGGVDVRASGAVAQVKVGSTATPRSEVEQIYGVARSEGKLGLVFSFAGFTADTITWAEKVGVALFVLKSAGTAGPIGTLATRLVTESQRSSPQGNLASPPRPKGRLIRTAADAEIVAAEWMCWMGFRDSTRTPTGADGGIDVRARDAVAQVKMHAKPIGRPDVQQLYGAARGRRALFFSLDTYTDEARSWADEVGMALFRFDLQGEPEAVNSAARTMLALTRSVNAEEPTTRVASVAVGSDETLGALLSRAEELGSLSSRLLVHLAPGHEGIADGRALAELVAATIDKPLRVITADQLHSDTTVEVRLLQRLVPGQVIYLDRVELFPTGPLQYLLAAFCDQLLLRPGDEAVADVVGEEAFGRVLHLVSDAVITRRVRVPHLLLSGPAGHGKAMLACVLANMMGGKLIITNSSVLKKVNDLQSILVRTEGPTVIFIDEIHQMPLALEGVLSEALEDGTLSVTVGTGSSTRTVRVSLPPILFVGATTEPEALSKPVCDLFGAQFNLEPRSLGELTSLVRRIWDRAELGYEDGAARFLAERSKGMPWRARHLALRVVQAHAEFPMRLTVDQLATLLHKVAFDDDGFSGTDWLLQDTGLGDTTIRFGPHGSLPTVSVIASTSLPWARGSDPRDGMGSLGTAIQYVLVMPPRLRSKNATMLCWEVRDIPLMR